MSRNLREILCYGDSNTWGWVPSSMGTQRFSFQERWPGTLQKLLGSSYRIIEEGLGGRTTMFDDPRSEFPLRNGLASLPTVLETHLPLDGVIVMLGTTDTKEMLKKDPQDSTEGMRQIIEFIKNCKIVNNVEAPWVLVIVPPIVREEAEFTSKLFKGGAQKGRQLKEMYHQLAQEEQVLFLDPTDDVIVDEEEGVHLDVDNHKKLARLVFNTLNKNI